MSDNTLFDAEVVGGSSVKTEIIKKDIIETSVTAIGAVAPLVGARVSNGILDVGHMVASDPSCRRLASRTGGAVHAAGNGIKNVGSKSIGGIKAKIDASKTEEAQAARAAKVNDLKKNKVVGGLFGFAARAKEQASEFVQACSIVEIEVVDSGGTIDNSGHCDEDVRYYEDTPEPIEPSDEAEIPDICKICKSDRCPDPSNNVDVCPFEKEHDGDYLLSVE